MTKPLLLLDVDGPLNPWRLITKKGYRPPNNRPDEEPFVYEKHFLHPAGWEAAGLPVLISPGHGEALRDLSESFTLVWATTWEEEANRLLGPLLGLPHLPVIEWPVDLRPKTQYPNHRGSWKTRHILTWLDDFALGPDGKVLPWAWVDDEVNAADRALVRDHYGYTRAAPPAVGSLLLHVDPSHGLRRDDFTVLRDFAMPWG